MPLVALFFLAASIVGAVRWYSPVRLAAFECFALPRMVRAREYMGRSVNRLGLSECRGAINGRIAIEDDPGAFRMFG